MAPRNTARPRSGGRGRPRKGDRGKDKPQKPKAKWLKTSADWARFNAWAKINAQPRKIPEPEEPVRQSKPLRELSKRLPFLLRPLLRCDERLNCRSDFEVSLAALCYGFASRRTTKLSWPKIRMFDYGRAVPQRVSRAALRYKPTGRIQDLSKPKIFGPEPKDKNKDVCGNVSKYARCHEPTERETSMAMAKQRCPSSLTEEERSELFTPAGVRRTALEYEFTDWMTVLSLPSYRSLKGRNDEDAREWRKMIVELSEKRGKKALAEQKRKRRKEALRRCLRRQRRAEEKRRLAALQVCGDTDSEYYDESEDEESETEAEETDESADAGADEGAGASAEETVDAIADAEDSVDEPPGATETEESTDETEEETQQPRRRASETGSAKSGSKASLTEEDAVQESTDETEEEAGQPTKKTSETGSDSSVKSSTSESQVSPEEDSEAKERERKEKKRKELKNAWRYEKSNCKEDPYSIRAGALNSKPTKRIEEMCKPNIHKDNNCKTAPFDVKQGALTASSSAGMDELAKPKRPRSPVEREPPREKDEYGRPIYERASFGKKLPRTKPYKMGQVEIKMNDPCKRTRPIDPIAFEQTVDPCACPSLSKLQTRERKRAEKSMGKKSGRRRTGSVGRKKSGNRQDSATDYETEED